MGYRTLLGDVRIISTISSEALAAVPSSVRCSSWVILATTRMVAIACGCLVTNLFVVGQQRWAAFARQRTVGSYGARRGLAVGSRFLLRGFTLWHWPSRHLPRLWFRLSHDVSYARMRFALRLGFRPPLAVRSLLSRQLPFPLGGQRAGEARGEALFAPHCGSRWADGAWGGGTPGRVGRLRATDECRSEKKRVQLSCTDACCLRVSRLIRVPAELDRPIRDGIRPCFSRSSDFRSSEPFWPVSHFARGGAGPRARGARPAPPGRAPRPCLRLAYSDPTT